MCKQRSLDPRLEDIRVRGDRSRALRERPRGSRKQRTGSTRAAGGRATARSRRRRERTGAPTESEHGCEGQMRSPRRAPASHPISDIGVGLCADKGENEHGARSRGEAPRASTRAEIVGSGSGFRPSRVPDPKGVRSGLFVRTAVRPLKPACSPTVRCTTGNPGPLHAVLFT